MSVTGRAWLESVPKTCPQIERSSSCRSRGAVFAGDFHFPARPGDRGLPP